LKLVKVRRDSAKPKPLTLLETPSVELTTSKASTSLGFSPERSRRAKGRKHDTLSG
jgi:hypothetical protein